MKTADWPTWKPTGRPITKFTSGPKTAPRQPGRGLTWRKVACCSFLQRGATVDEPGNAAQQRRVLEADLALLAQDAPLDIVRLDEEP